MVTVNAAAAAARVTGGRLGEGRKNDEACEVCELVSPRIEGVSQIVGSRRFTRWPGCTCMALASLCDWITLNLQGIAVLIFTVMKAPALS